MNTAPHKEAFHQASAEEPFLMNCWYVAAWDHELIDGKLLARTILDKPVVMYRGDSGRVAALDDRCIHRGTRLSHGRREGDDLRCMYPGLKFDASGKRIQIPGQENIPPRLGVLLAPRLRAREDAGWLRRVRVQVKADGDRAAGCRLPRGALAPERAAAAVPPQGRAER